MYPLISVAHHLFYVLPIRGKMITRWKNVFTIKFESTSSSISLFLPAKRNYCVYSNSDNNKLNQMPSSSVKEVQKDGKESTPLIRKEEEKKLLDEVNKNNDFFIYDMINPKLFETTDELINYLHQPRLRKGLLILRIIFTILAGLYFGSFLAKLGANLLEEYEIFVRGDDDDD